MIKTLFMHTYYREILAKTLDLETEKMGRVVRSYDRMEAVKAIIAKRPPKFKER